jgi:hypothetical protein
MTASSFMRSVEAASIQWPVQPAARSLREHLGGVVAALAGDDDVAALEGLDVERILERRLVLGLGRGLAAGIGSGEEHRLDEAEVAFGLHAVHQDRADHAAPADQADQRLLCLGECHRHTPLKWFLVPRLVWPGRGARRTGAC